jgi:5'-nucleotidase
MEKSSDKTLVILHFNDAYNIEERKEEPCGGVARFVTALREHDSLDPLILFSGDIFSPSSLSVIYEGEHMIKPLNSFGIHVACTGNHDFDFDNEQATSLFQRSNFPWLLTNIKMKSDGKPFPGTSEFHVINHHGFRVGVIGLAESEWIETLESLTLDDLDYEDFVTCAERWGKHLRVEEKCDIVIALTHMRTPSDVNLALHCSEVDLILGGHDHVYHVSKHNEKFVIKSGTDFREFTIIKLNYLPADTLHDIAKHPEKHPGFKAENLCKNKFHLSVEKIDVTRKLTPDPELEKHVRFYNDQYEKSMDIPMAFTAVDLETRFSKIRSEETNFGNFMADLCRMHAQTDVCIVNSGTLRSDCLIPKGVLKLREIKNILPITDKLVTLEVSGEQLLRALECGICRYPSLEGRFPCISGMTLTVDGQAEPYRRVIKESVKIGGLPLQSEKKYTLACKAFIAGGKDGYEVLGTCKRLLDDELADDLESIILKFLELANDKELAYEIEKRFHLEDQSMPSLQKVLSQDNDHISGASPRNVPNACTLVRRKSSDLRKTAKKIHFMELMHNVIQKDGHSYIEICPMLDGRMKILNANK